MEEAIHVEELSLALDIVEGSEADAGEVVGDAVDGGVTEVGVGTEMV